MNSHPITTVILLTVIILFETLFPFRTYFSRLKHYGKNAIFSLLNGLLTGLSSAFMSVYAFTLIEKYRLGLLNQIQLPALASMVAAFLMFDLWIYSWHRLNHIIPFLWRFHQVHHNDIEMDMSTALRFHPGEILMASMLNVIIFIIAGLSIEQIIVYKGIFHINVMIHHSNIAIPESFDRLLRLFIVSPNTHRVHHSIKREETDSNFSSVLTVWDRMFGTYRESDPEKIVFGLESDRTEECQTIKYLLKLPFKKLRQIDVSTAKSMLSEGNIVVLDARKNNDYHKSHIEGALSIEGGALNDFIDRTDKSRTVLCYCYKGISSKRLCRKLIQAGFRNVCNLKGGFNAWCKK